MRVAIVQESIDARRGGAETSTMEMAAALGARGIEVCVLHAASQREEARIETVRTIGVPVTTGGSKLARTRKYLAGAAHLTSALRVDIVHAVLPLATADVYQPRGGTYPETIERTLALARPAAWRSMKRFARLLNRRQRLLLNAERRLLARQNPVWVACVSQYVRKQVLAIQPRVNERAVVVFNGVAPPARLHASMRDTLRQRWKLSNRPVVLFVANNFRLKGLRELLLALSHDHGAAKYQVVVAGRDKPAPYERLARRLAVADRVRFIGPAPAAELYAVADAVCHPTWYDPCSRVALEALACNIPVITTAWNGAAEVISHGRDGFVVNDPNDAPALAAAIRSALALASQRGALPAAPFEWTMARHAEGLHRLYDRILESRKSGLRN